MNQLALLPTLNLPIVPELIAAAGDRASLPFLEFFAATIRNPHTRRAYGRAVAEFLTWCADVGVSSIAAVQPLHVATWIEMQARKVSAPSVKQRLAAVRHLFDWLVTGQVVPVNPAASVRGPQHIVRHGKTPVLEAVEARALLDSIKVVKTKTQSDGTEIDTGGDFRHRPTRPGTNRAHRVFTRPRRRSAARGMKVEDVCTQNRRLWVRLREKGGKTHAMPCHHSLEECLHAYIDGAGLLSDAKGPLFRTIARGTGRLSTAVMSQADAHAMIRRRAAAAGIETLLGNHGFRATGITDYLKNGGTLERAASMANHASTRTTQLYDRRRDEMTLNDVERIRV